VNLTLVIAGVLVIIGLAAALILGLNIERRKKETLKRRHGQET
jgi:hypothetical protein